MKTYLDQLIQNQSLTKEEAFTALSKIAAGEVNTSQIAAFLMGIQQKGITAIELEGFREAMLEVAVKIDLSEFDAMDVCGTGGDGKDTFNISTTSAFIVAGAGQKVAKHGNHGVSSSVGSSTVLEHLGIKFTNDTDYLKKKLETAGICYLHAPLFHPAMRHVGPVRKELGMKTFFNMLGPLLNPAEVKKQISGVYDLCVFELYEQVFRKLGGRFGVVFDLAVYDEISLTGDFMFSSHFPSADEGELFSPSAFGLEAIKPEEIYGGGSLEESAQIMKNILANKGTMAQTNVVLANAAMALGVARNIPIKKAFAQAKESLESGKALKALQLLAD
ncbi:anthranilate phosphoribosyltransferase [Jiulongibacter sediminis]|uniref:Anthranilate phosphoribosyltransferase n=1 Tax=Jiulongibacter sediminis TaxID=1605367 RepID=A0A0P7BN73_9BACT|nr:anthranilate phosphoribosyltransferase [Jiulongibacter sediminis]KPM48699.1 anthranilate phosphoribosyltransferase [Jiulongibacter sediminis]TBX25234.1 anthranilate phosphoribosyltransferase [Jiulongibacter sediminis]